MLSLFDHSFSTYKTETKALLMLALPMLLASIAQVGTGFVDAVMAGGAGIDDLAAVALGSSLFVTVYVSLVGVMTALNPLLSQKLGENAHSEIGELGRQGLWLGLSLGLVGMLLLWVLIVPFQHFVGLTPSTFALTKNYVWLVGLGMPAAMLQRALHAYSLSLGHPGVITVISWLCFFLNIPLNFIFVYGKFGLPALGGAGCGLATALVFWFNIACLWAYIAYSRHFRPFGLMTRFSPPNWATQKRLLGLGIPIGLSFFIEVSLFTCIMFLVARLPGDTENYVAAQQVVMSLTTLIFMIPQSLGIASTAKVGYYLGQQDFAKARYASGVAISFAVLMSLLTAAILLLGRHELARLYTDNATVIGIAAGLMVFAAGFQLMDAVQCVASYALRGYKRTKFPMLIHMLSFWGIGLVPGYYFAFHTRLGIYGFWLALVGSLAVAAVFLLWYLGVCSKAMMRR